MLHHTSDTSCPMCEDKLKSAHPDLQNWFKTHIKPNFPNAHVSWAYRNETDQEHAFADHRSKLRFPHSAHNKTPALALDLFEIIESGEGSWNPSFFININRYNEERGIKLKWGALFRLLGDTDHFEIIT